MFGDKIKVVQQNNEYFFKYKDFLNVFTNIKRVDIPKMNKKKSSELGLKGRDIYVNQRGVRKIILKSKIKNPWELEEKFFEEIFKRKYNISFENIDLTNFIENEIQSKNEIVETKIKKNLKKRNPRSASSSESEITVILKKSENVFLLRTVDGDKLKNVRMEILHKSTQNNFLSVLKNKIKIANKKYENPVIELKNDTINIIEPMTEKKFIRIF